LAGYRYWNPHPHRCRCYQTEELIWEPDDPSRQGSGPRHGRSAFGDQEGDYRHPPHE